MKKKILVVDDDLRILTMVKRRLEFAGHVVVTATDGREALRLGRAEHPDLIVLDLILPGLNGYQVCAMLKGDRLLRSIPILMLSARSQTRDVEEGMKVGADAYLTKPYDPETFIGQVDSLLRRADEARVAQQAELRAREKREQEADTRKAEQLRHLFAAPRTGAA